MSEKTYVFDSASNNGILSLLGPLMQQRGVDPNVLLALQGNNGFGGEGGWFIWIIFLFFLMGWGNNGFGNRGFANEVNNDFGRGVLLQAIDGNGDAINQLASTLHCDVNQINTAINNVQSLIQGVGNQVGLSSQQVINAIQSGNCQIASQIASCCCEVRTSMERGFASISESTFRQTCDIEKAIAASTASITSRLDAMEKTTLLDKIDRLREEKSTLTNQLSQEHQSLAIFQNTAAELAPITAALNDLHHEIDGIKCKMPSTVTANYQPYTVVPNCAYNTFCGYGNYGWNGWNNGSLWG